MPQKRKTHGLKIYHRFHFASALKRMSVIAGHTAAGSSETDYIATVKGAPETLKSMVRYIVIISNNISGVIPYRIMRMDGL